jgi:hypothetical protein
MTPEPDSTEAAGSESASPELGLTPEILSETTPMVIEPAAATPDEAAATATATAAALPLASPVADPVVTMPEPSDIIERVEPVPTVTPVSLDAISIEALTADRAVTPGQVSLYRFAVRNSAESAVSVELSAVNTLEGWTGTVLNADGSTPDAGPLTIKAGRAVIVSVAVVVPAEAWVGEQNSVSLGVALVEQPPAAPSEQPEPELAREPDDEVRLEDLVEDGAA